MAILLSNNIAQCGDVRAAVGWAWTGRNLILDEALATCGHTREKKKRAAKPMVDRCV